MGHMPTGKEKKQDKKYPKRVNLTVLGCMVMLKKSRKVAGPIMVIREGQGEY